MNFPETHPSGTCRFARPRQRPHSRFPRSPRPRRTPTSVDGAAHAPQFCACALVPRMLRGDTGGRAAPPLPSAPRFPSAPGFPFRELRRPPLLSFPRLAALLRRPWQLGHAGLPCGSAPQVQAWRGWCGWARGPSPDGVGPGPAAGSAEISLTVAPSSDAGCPRPVSRAGRMRFPPFGSGSRGGRKFPARWLHLQA